MALKLKLKTGTANTAAAHAALRERSATSRRSSRTPDPGMPEKHKPVGPGNAKSVPGYQGVGEPSHFKPEYIDLMCEYFSRDPWEIVTDCRGTPRLMPKDKLPTLARFAQSIGFRYATMLKWAKVHPDFGAAYEECKKLQEAFILESGGLTLNGNFAAFMLKCNHGMRDDTPDENQQPISKVSIEIIDANKAKSDGATS